MKELSTTDVIVSTARTLAQLKNIVSRNLSATIDAGRALKEIKDRELWKEEAESFQQFCVDNWGVSKQRAYQLIDSVNIVDQLPPEQSTAVDSERAARELKKAPVAEREAIIKEVQAKGAVTGPTVAKAVKEHKAKEPGRIFDRTGFEIPHPSPASQTWMRSQEIQEMLSAISKIKAKVERGCSPGNPKDADPVYTEINFSAFVADLQSSFQLLKVALPYSVCPTCQGRVLSPCSTCNGRGTISEFYWKHKVPEKTKEIRERAVQAILDDKKGKK